jgi:hypothetical protein
MLRRNARCAQNLPQAVVAGANLRYTQELLHDVAWDVSEGSI